MIRQRFSFFDRAHLMLLVLIIGGIATGVYLISQQRISLRSKAAQESPPVSAFFALDRSLKQRGKEFQLIVKLNPNDSSFYGFDLYFTYDKDKVELTSNFLDDIGQAYDPAQGFFKRIEKDKNADKIQIYGAKLGGEPLSGKDAIEIAKIRFKLRDNLLDGDKILFNWDSENTKIAGDKVAVNIDRQEGTFVFGSDETRSQQIAVIPPQQSVAVPPVVIPPQEALPILAPTEGTEVAQTSLLPPPLPTVVPALPTPTVDSPRPTVAPTPTLTSAVMSQNTLSILLKFQGISTKPKRTATIPVVVTIAGGQPAKTLIQTIQFTADDNGIWKGVMSASSVPQGSGYALSMQGPYHVKKKICHQSPRENKSGSYTCSDGQISIKSESQTVDFSGITLLAGDLPSADGVQDGVINSRDAVFVRTNLLSQDSKIRDKADIDFNNEINVIDYALVLKAIEIQSVK